MSHRPGGRLVAVLLPALALLIAPAAAHAERVVTEDAVADVVAVEFGKGDDLEQSVVTPAPDVTTVDVTKTVVDHRAANVRVVVRYRDVRPARLRLMVLQLRTPHGRYEVLVVGMRGTRTYVELHRKGRGPVECQALRSSLDRTSDRSTTMIPTTCLDAPRWVQVGVGSLTANSSTEDPETKPILVDDAHLTGKIRENTLALGPKVRRG